MNNRKYDVSEDKLKNLQRKEALNDSEQYNISDDTYNRRPLTRQYVEDDVITKGGEFVDDDEPIIVYNDESHGDEVYDYSEEANIETPVIVDDEPAPRRKEEQPVVINIPKFEPIYPRPETSLTVVPDNNSRLDEDERDYLDRDNTIRSDDNQFEPVNNKPVKKTTEPKPQKEKKPLNLSWLKPAGIILVILISIIVAIVLFRSSAANNNGEAVNYVHNDYAAFVEDTRVLIAFENTQVKEFKNLTEQYLIGGLLEKQEYLNRISTIKTNMSQKASEYSLQEYSSVDVYDVKFVVVDYTKTLINTIDMLLTADTQTDLQLKTLILNEVNDRLATRTQQFSNVANLLNSTAEKYQIESEFKEKVFYLDIEIEQ